MITMFTGSPGAGKTASLVDYLSKLDSSRPLYVDGLEGLTLPHTPIDSNNWPTFMPDGAILVIDEAQRVWRPRGSGSKVPESVAALETHRHHGIDVFFTTQAPALIDSNVRNLVGRHIHIRDTGIMGRWWYEWPETSTGMVWKTCINKRRFKLPKAAFDLYKSSSMHVKPVRGVPRILLIVIALLILSAFMIYGVVRMLGRFTGVGVSKPVPAVISSVPGQNPIAPGQTIKAVSTSSGGVRLIDDRVDFIPRISNKPESAPAYDHLRLIVAMPVVSGAICINDACTCITSQGSDPGLSPAECAAWAKNRPFNPYLVENPSAGNQNPSNSAPGHGAATTASGVSSLRAPV